MLYGTLVAGTYGIYQYFALPRWDSFWMENVRNVTFGPARPMEIHVFSVMNAPQILALFLAVGMLLALHSQDKLRFIAVPVAALAFVLTSARTAWVSFLVGLLYLVSKAHSRLRLQLLLVVAVSLVLFAVALEDPRVAFIVSQRINTLSDVSHDDSFISRVEGHEELLSGISDVPFGLGLGSQENGSGVLEHTVGKHHPAVMQGDSTVAAIVTSLGGAGSLLAAASFLFFASSALRLCATPGGPAEAIKMLALVLLTEVLFNNIINGPAGFLSWTILALCLAAKRPSALDRSVSDPKTLRRHVVHV